MRDVFGVILFFNVFWVGEMWGWCFWGRGSYWILVFGGCYCIELKLKDKYSDNNGVNSFCLLSIRCFEYLGIFFIKFYFI